MTNDYPNSPGHRGVSTSIEAGDAIASACGRLHLMALSTIREAGDEGVTTDELAARLNLQRWTIQPRTSELRRKGLIRDSGQRRLNITGKRAIVWTAVTQEVANA